MKHPADYLNGKTVKYSHLMKKVPFVTCVLGVSAFQIFFFFPAFLPFAALSRCLNLWQSVDEI